MADSIKLVFGLSERRSCKIVGICRSTKRYNPAPDKDIKLRKRLKELARQRQRNGCPMFHRILKREGLVINHKKTERIYNEENLAIKRKNRRRRKAVQNRGFHVHACEPNHIWAMDFMSDSLWKGARFRTLNIIDECTRECLAIEVDTSINGLRVTRVLEALKERMGKPQMLRIDNGPEFISKALDDWASKNNIHLQFIDPGKPVQNTWIESFNRTFREECLNTNWFSSLKEAREIIKIWMDDYNTFRPHSSLNDFTPKEFFNLYLKKKVS